MEWHRISCHGGRFHTLRQQAVRADDIQGDLPHTWHVRPKRLLPFCPLWHPYCSHAYRPWPSPLPPSSFPQRAWAESHSRCPLICLLSPGSDPTKLIEDLAKKKKIKTLGVSMGQGQEVRVMS